MLVVDKEFQSLIPPLSEEEYAGLEQSILGEGCRDAIVIWRESVFANGSQEETDPPMIKSDPIIVDGHNRYEICTRHGIPFKTTELDAYSRDEVTRWIITNQFSRRNLSAYDRSLLALKLKPMIAEKAEKNLHLSDGKGCQKPDKVKTVDTKKELATIAGVSHDTIHKVETIEKKATPEVKSQIKSGEKSINQAYQEVRRAEKESAREEKRQENAEKVEQLSSPLDAQGLFQTIVIDPPWDWGDEGDVNQFGRAKPDYHTMPIEDIAALPVGKVADENCHLYLWVTNRSLPKAFGLIEKWGFRYVTCLTWVKPSIGMGNYFRGTTEQVLFAVKGSQQLKRHDVGTHFEAPRGDRHSAKPNEFYSLVESCSYGPYIDIFGRKGRKGWSVWGEGS